MDQFQEPGYYSPTQSSEMSPNSIQEQSGSDEARSENQADVYMPILVVLPQVISTVLQSHIEYLKPDNYTWQAQEGLNTRNLQNWCRDQMAQELTKLIQFKKGGGKDWVNEILIGLLNLQNVFVNVLKLSSVSNLIFPTTEQKKDLAQEQLQFAQMLIERLISQIYIKILEVLNWLAAFSEEIQPKIQNELIRKEIEEQIKRVAIFFLEYIPKLGNRPKPQQQHGFYFTKLISIKNQSNWSNQFINQWMNKKKQISMISFNPSFSLEKNCINKLNELILTFISMAKGEIQFKKKERRKYEQRVKRRQRNKYKPRKDKSQKSEKSIKSQRMQLMPNAQMSRYQQISKLFQYNKRSEHGKSIKEKKDLVENQMPQIPKAPQPEIFNIYELFKRKTSQNKEEGVNKKILTKQEFSMRKTKRDYLFRSRSNIMAYMNRYFQFQNEQTLQQYLDMLKCLFRAQQLFMKGVINKIIKCARISNQRLDSQVQGDQFRYYSQKNAKVSQILFRKSQIYKNEQQFHGQISNQQKKPIFIKLTYPSKLQSYFSLKFQEYQKQFEMYQTVNKLASTQNTNNSNTNVKKFSQNMTKYLCDQWTKESVKKLQDLQTFPTKRLKLSINLIRDVILEDYGWIFAAQKGFYRY